MTFDKNIFKHFLILFFLAFTLNAYSARTPTILPKPSSSSCSFYVELENILNCEKESTYLPGYGHPYCLKFQEMEKVWSHKLKKWVPETTYCLQSELIRDRSNLSPCKLMEDTAFGSHPTCYMKYGFCEFTYSDKQRVMNVVAGVDLIRSPSQSVAQLLRVKSTCDMTIFEGFFHLYDYLFQVTAAMDIATKNLSGEILFNTPTISSTTANLYITQMLYVLQTGDASLDKTAFAYYERMGNRLVPQTIESSFDECRLSISKNAFCKKMKDSNSVAFEKAVNGNEFLRALNPSDVAKRIKKANDISKKWNDKVSK